MLWKKKRKSGGNRPLFLVIRRRWLAAAGTAVMAAAILWAVNWPAAVDVSASVRQLPIYCVQRDQKVLSISFDAAWGDDRLRPLGR